MRTPFRSRFSFGVIDGYSSDSAYLAAIGSSPRRGDVYFNTTSQRYRFYDGDEWKDLSLQAFPQARLIDHTFASVPSGAQTVDGIVAVPGDIVILANYDNNAYRVQLGAWTLESLFSAGSVPGQGDGAYIQEGSVYGDTLQWYDGTTWRLLTVLTEGTAVDQVPRWNGVRYVANPDFLASGSTLTTKDDNTNDAIQAQGIALVGGDKTAGTGDGGDVMLIGGSSVGGQQGRIEINALATTFVNKTVLPSSPTQGDWLMYNGRFRYWDGTQWSLIYPLPTGITLGSILAWNGSNWVEDPLLTASGASISSPADAVNDASAPIPIFVTGAAKVAGTGNGGDVRLAGGTSFGGARGKVRLNRVEIDYPTLATGTTSAYVLDDTTADAVKAASWSIHASNKTAGTGDGGDLFLNAGTSAGGLQGSAAINARKIRLDAQAAADPTGGLTADVYYSTAEMRFKYYDGTNWRPLGAGGGPFPVDYVDTTSTALPTTAPFSPDGTAVVTGDLVLFKNLSNPTQDDRVYKATVSGPSITWQLQIFGQSPSSVPTDGDSVYVRKGATQADTLWFYNGTDWYDYGATLSSLYANRTLSNLTSPTAINQHVLPGTDYTYDLGSSGSRWRNLYLGGNLIQGSSTTYVETTTLSTFTIANNQSTPAAVFSVPQANLKSYLVEYEIERNGFTRFGTILMCHDGTNASRTDTGTETGSVGVTFSVGLSGGYMHLFYTSDNTGTGTLRYYARRIIR